MLLRMTSVYSRMSDVREMLKTMVSTPYKAVLRHAPDKLALKIEYYRRLGRFPDLDNPTLFTEKCQVRKIRDRDPRLPVIVDKIRAKEYVAERLGDEWIIPTLWHGPRLPPLAERDWPLPFVLKANHSSGGNVFARSAKDLDWPAIEERTARWLSRPYEPHTRQWAYNAIPPELLVEPFVGEVGELPVDFKLWVFNGRVEFIGVHTDRATQHKRAFYNREWVKQPFVNSSLPLEHRHTPKPASLDEMIRGAEVLAEGMSFLRVDLYELAGRPLFGEMTLFPASGLGKFSPRGYDKVLGDLMRL